jgi:phosphatidate cytidylyltransferase
LNIKISNSFKHRLLSGLLLAPLTLLIIYFGGIFFAGLILIAFLIAVKEWLELSKKCSKPKIEFIVGLIYSFICFGAFAYIRLELENGLYFCLALIVCVWASDIGAYFVGKKFGGLKIAPYISPNKTLSGLIGAMMFCGLSLCLFYYLFFIEYNQHSYVLVFLAGMVLGFIGQTGDLFVSAAKRRANIKDTGNLIPGHGGLLDRIDSLMLVSPVFLSFVILWVL